VWLVGLKRGSWALRAVEIRQSSRSPTIDVAAIVRDSPDRVGTTLAQTPGMRKIIPNVLAVAIAAFTLTVAPQWVNAQSLVPATPAALQGEEEAPRLTETEPGYRLQIAAVDLAAFSLMVSGGLIDHHPTGLFLVLGGVATYALGSPVLQFMHGRTKASAASLLLRTGVPALLGTLAHHRASGCDADNSAWGPDFCQLDALVEGVLIGMVAASVVDIAFLAGPREVERTPARASNKPELSGFALVPSNNGGSVLLSGRF